MEYKYIYIYVYYIYIYAHGVYVIHMLAAAGEYSGQAKAAESKPSLTLRKKLAPSVAFVVNGYPSDPWAFLATEVEHLWRRLASNDCARSWCLVW